MKKWFVPVPTTKCNTATNTSGFIYLGLGEKISHKRLNGQRNPQRRRLMDAGHPHRHSTAARHQPSERISAFHSPAAASPSVGGINLRGKRNITFGDFNSHQFAVHSRGGVRMSLQFRRRKTRSSLINSGPPHIRLPVYTEPRTFCPFCRRSGSEWKSLDRISVLTTGWRWSS